MTNLRRLMGLPRLPISIYILILALLLVFAYMVAGPAPQFFTKLASSMGSFYEPTDFEREDHEKGIKRCFHDLLEQLLEQMKRKAEGPGH